MTYKQPNRHPKQRSLFYMILDESIVPENGGTIPDLLDTIKGDKFKLINKIPTHPTPGIP